MRTIRNAACAAVLLAALPAVAERSEATAKVAQIAAILDYVMVDYGTAVGEGGVRDPAEWREQQGFLAEALEVAGGLPEADRRAIEPPLSAALADARTAAPPSRVVAETGRALDGLRGRYLMPRAPAEAPSLARGQALYRVGCVACHSEDGSGRNETAARLSTRVPDARARAFSDTMSPLRVFNSTSYGVPGTAMPSYRETWDEAQRWDIAFYYLALAHPDAGEARLPSPGLARLASTTDGSLRAELAAAGLDRRAAEETLGAWRRTPPPPTGSLAACRRLVVETARRYGTGAVAQARALAVSAYLDEFEPHEAALRVRDTPLVVEIEDAFAALRADAERGRPAAAVAQDAARIEALLDEADSQPGRGGAGVSFVAALVIALREGLEASLLLAALLAIAGRSGQAGARGCVHAGWAIALAAGLATWWLSGAVIARGGARREEMEGIIELSTAALLLAGSHWLLAQASAKRWVGFLSRRAAGASAVGLGVVAFLGIYREAFEVVAFYRGLLIEAAGEGRAIAMGALAGLVALVLVVVFFQKLGRRLQPRPLLLGSGVLLCGLAFAMVGEGVRALQESGIVGIHPLDLPQLPAFGVFATGEGLGVQGMLLAALLGSIAYTALRSREQRAAVVTGRTPALR